MKYLAIVFLSLLSYVSVADETHPEVRLLDAVQSIQALKFDKAEQQLNQLINERPDFQLAQLVYADVLMAKTGALPDVGVGLKQSEHRSLLLAEIRNRYSAANDAAIQYKYPAVLARLDSHYRHSIVVDLSKSRLYVFDTAGETPKLVDDYFVSMGRGGSGKVNEGDLKTPMGVYFVQSYISPGQLADKYGSGAYPINYPNAWDRLNGKTGHGIWLHGTRSGTYNRPPLASEGCVVLPNEDLLTVGSYIDLKNTPLLIGENIQWLSLSQWQQHQLAFNQIHQQWKKDWESLDVENYLAHYSARFYSGKQNFVSWAEHKRRVAQYKTFVDVELSNLSLLLHPNEDVMVATYLQSYNSDNFSSQSWKRQYWNREADGQWRIVFEGEISAPVTEQLARN
jgi:murein L,D-transpeptidase YafK